MSFGKSGEGVNGHRKSRDVNGLDLDLVACQHSRAHVRSVYYTTGQRAHRCLGLYTSFVLSSLSHSA